MTANRAAAYKASAEHHDRMAANAETRRANKAKEAEERRKTTHGAIGSYVKSGVDLVGHVAKLVNDPAWYMKIPGTGAAGNVNAIKLGGVPYEISGWNDTDKQEEILTFIPPQILLAKYHPTVGTTTSRFANTGTHSTNRYLVNPLATTDFQKAAQELFAYLRKKNGGSLNGLDPSDVLEALICFGEVAGMREHLVRLYRLMNSWEKGERVVPSTLIASIYGIPTGCTAQTVMNYWSVHRIELLSLINVLTKRLNTLPIPKSFAYALRRIYLNSRIFVETPEGSLYKKYYAYVPLGFLKWLDVPETITTSGGVDLDVMVLGEKVLSSGITSIADVQSLITEVSDALFDSTDISLVCSYIMNSFSVEERSDKMLYFEPVKEDEVMYFDFDESFGLQFRNIKCYGDTAVGDIGTSAYATQFAVCERLTNGTIWQNKRYNSDLKISSATGLHIMDIMKPAKAGEINQAECFEASRNIVSVKTVTDNSTPYSYIDQVGTEAFTTVDAIEVKTDGSLYTLKNSFVTGYQFTGLGQQFKYMPIFPFVSNSSTLDDMHNIRGGNLCLHTWTILNSNQLDLLHRVAVYSEFLVDEVVF